MEWNALDPLLEQFPTRASAPAVLRPQRPDALGAREEVAPDIRMFDDESTILEWLNKAPAKGDACQTSARVARESGFATPSSFRDLVLPGDLVANVGAQPGAVYATLKWLLPEVVPTELEEDTSCTVAEGVGPLASQRHCLKATAFFDMVPVHLDITVRISPPGGFSGSVVVFRHTSKTDVVAFHRLTENVVKAMVGQGLHVHGCPTRNLQRSLWLVELSDDEFYDALSHEEWCDVITPLWQDAFSKAPSIRESAWQVLARMAKGYAGCAMAMAKAVLEYEDLIYKAFEQSPAASLAELYPLAVILGSITSVPHAAASLVVSRLFTAADHSSREPWGQFPQLVAKELSQAAENLRGCPGAPLVEQPTKDAEVGAFYMGDPLGA